MAINQQYLFTTSFDILLAFSFTLNQMAVPM